MRNCVYSRNNVNVIQVLPLARCRTRGGGKKLTRSSRPGRGLQVLQSWWTRSAARISLSSPQILEVDGSSNPAVDCVVLLLFHVQVCYFLESLGSHSMHAGSTAWSVDQFGCHLSSNKNPYWDLSLGHSFEFVKVISTEYNLVSWIRILRLAVVKRKISCHVATLNLFALICCMHYLSTESFGRGKELDHELLSGWKMGPHRSSGACHQHCRCRWKFWTFYGIKVGIPDIPGHRVCDKEGCQLVNLIGSLHHVEEGPWFHALALLRHPFSPKL